MNVKMIPLTKILLPIALGSILIIGVFYSLPSHAADGCGFGYHSTAFGRCVPNSPGPDASPAPGRPDCWYNRFGELRCWR
jgi:hypothetical protein